ncbi:MAG: hypothetical protein WCX32_02485 [Clostridia bacterium]|jgi:hypothetical protein|nr:hypothetical protein [Clostridia bacterium]MDD4275848.1 hypothetical protein [Clostridia bacterium]
MDKIKQQIKNVLFKVEDNSEHKNADRLIEFFTSFENCDYTEYEKNLEEYISDLKHLEDIVLQESVLANIKQFLIFKRTVSHKYNLNPDYDKLINLYTKNAKSKGLDVYLDKMFSLYYYKFKTVEEMQDLIFNLEVNPLTEKLYGGIIWWIYKLSECKGVNFAQCEDNIIKRMQVLNETVKYAKETNVYNDKLSFSLDISQNNCVRFARQNENANIDKLISVVTMSGYKQLLEDIKQERLNELPNEK